MLDRIKDAIKSQPWMIATVVLAVSLAISLVVLATGSPAPGADETPSASTTPPGSDTTEPGDARTDQLAIVVDNAPAARPQVGLGAASVLVEYPVEGGLTRFVAVVPDGSGGLVGPVRSLRPVNAPLVPALASTVISTGGQPFVLRDVEATGLTSVTPDAITGFVSLGRVPPHDVFVDLDEMAGAFVAGSPAPGLPAGDALPTMRTVATEVDLPYEGIALIYEAGEGYVRHEGGQPFEVLDPSGSSPIALSHDTVVVISAAQRSAGYEDTNGVGVSTFDVIGSGELRVFHEGEMTVGTWSRAALADRFVFRDDIGEQFGLPEGRIYLAIVSRDSEIVTR